MQSNDTKQLEQVWGPDDFDQCVADARALVEAGKRPLRLVDEIHAGALNLQFTSASRRRKARLMDGLAVALLFTLMAALGVVAYYAGSPQ